MSINMLSGLMPFCTLLVSICIALIFVLIPNANYWIFAMVKCQIWACLGLIAFTEMEDICLPDGSNLTYVLAYIIGFITPPIVHYLAYVWKVENNFYINAFAVTSAILSVIVCYGIDVWKHPEVSNHSSTVTDNATVNALQDSIIIVHDKESAEEKIAAATDCELYDTFSAAIFHPDTHDNNNNIRTTNDNDIIIDVDRSEQQTHWLQVKKEQHQKIVHDAYPKKQASLSTEPYIVQYLLPYLPRTLFRSSNPLTYSQMTKRTSRRVQWIYASLFNVFFNNYYYFLIWFTVYFRNSSDVMQYKKIALFLFYVVVSAVFCNIIKRIGLVLDRGKMNSISMFFIGEVMCLLFYYTFYRVLFESISSWSVFLAMQSIHLLSEWVLYPMRGTAMYYTFVTNMNQQWNKNILYKVISCIFTTNNLGFKDWQSFITLDYGLRCVVVVLSSLGISILLLTIAFIPSVDISLKQSNHKLGLTLGFIGVSTALEIINAFICNEVYFKRIPANISQMIVYCLNNKRFLFVFTVIASILFINPMAAFETHTKF